MSVHGIPSMKLILKLKHIDDYIVFLKMWLFKNEGSEAHLGCMKV